MREQDVVAVVARAERRRERGRRGRRAGVVRSRLPHDRRPAVVQEVHVEVGDLLPLVAQRQPAGRLERAEDRRLDVLAGAEPLAARPTSPAARPGPSAPATREIQISV